MGDELRVAMSINKGVETQLEPWLPHDHHGSRINSFALTATVRKTSGCTLCFYAPDAFIIPLSHFFYEDYPESWKPDRHFSLLSSRAPRVPDSISQFGPFARNHRWLPIPVNRARWIDMINIAAGSQFVKTSHVWLRNLIWWDSMK